MADGVNMQSLLSPTDPEPVEVVNAQSRSAILLVCEHAGRNVPAALGRLGLSDAEFDSHIGWDIGAEAVARNLSKALDAPLILQRYSRLVIDCNRPPGTKSSIPEITAGIRVPGNATVSADARQARQREIFRRYDAALADWAARPSIKAIFSVHSFTPDFPGQDRPWDAGFLSRKDVRTAQGIMRHIESAAPTLKLALNEPYQIENETDWLIPRYAETRNLRHTLIEIRNTHITGNAGQERWSALLSEAILNTIGAAR